jgi:hypothetical protein
MRVEKSVYEIWVRMRVERRVRDRRDVVRLVSRSEAFFYRGGYPSLDAAEMEAERLSLRFRGSFFVEEADDGCVRGDTASGAAGGRARGGGGAWLEALSAGGSPSDGETDAVSDER